MISEINIGVQIALFQRAITVQIFKQAYPNNNCTMFVSPHNSFDLKTASEPELSGGNQGTDDATFYMRGDAVRNNWKVCMKTFDSNIERDQYLKRLEQTFEEWGNSEELKFTKRDLGHTWLLMIDGETDL